MAGHLLIAQQIQQFGFSWRRLRASTAGTSASRRSAIAISRCTLHRRTPSSPRAGQNARPAQCGGCGPPRWGQSPGSCPGVSAGHRHGCLGSSTSPSTTELSGVPATLSELFSSVKEKPAAIRSTPSTSSVSAVAFTSRVQVLPVGITTRSAPVGTPAGLQFPLVFR